MKKEAPKKLYYAPYGDIREDHPITDNDIEYIRADTFVEKAQLFLIDKLKEIPMGGGKMKIKADCSLEEFIEDFLNYMKGE